MPLDPHIYLKILNDRFTPVRDTTGALLGCIPRVADGSDFVTTSSGQMFDLAWAAQPCVMVDLKTQSPSQLDGFVALDDTDTDLAVPAVASGDEDLGEAV